MPVRQRVGGLVFFRCDDFLIDVQSSAAGIEIVAEYGLVIIVLRLVPRHRPDWTPDKHCRILAGWYADEHGEPVFISEQVGEILGWSYCEWVDEEPQAIKMYVRVRQEP